jgi:hypothetical protein
MKSFKSPNETKIPARSSTITSAFVNSIVPNIDQMASELQEAYEILGLDDERLMCSYCRLTHATEWDHFRATVENKMPTGYLAEIYNLVPACGKCNQSKGGKPWRDWIQSKAKLSPSTRKVPNLDHIIQTLEAYEKWSNSKVRRVPYSTLDAELKDLLAQHWNNRDKIVQQLYDAQKLAEQIKKRIRELNDW